MNYLESIGINLQCLNNEIIQYLSFNTNKFEVGDVIYIFQRTYERITAEEKIKIFLKKSKVDDIIYTKYVKEGKLDITIHECKNLFYSNLKNDPSDEITDRFFCDDIVYYLYIEI